MSNDELYYDALTDLSERIAKGLQNRTKPLNELNQALNQLIATNSIRGQAADKMKAYISEVHFTLIQTLQLLLNNYQMALGKYVQGYLEVDSNHGFQLVREDLEAHQRNLTAHRSDFSSLAKQLKAISDEAEDIVWLGGAGGYRLTNVANEMDVMKKTASNLMENWTSYEQTDPGFSQVQDLLSQTKNLLKQTLSVPRGYSYSPGRFSQLMSSDFLSAFQANAAYAQNTANQAEFQKDWKNIGKSYEADQKAIAKKAAQKAGVIGLIFDALQIVAGAAIAVAGGILTPFSGGLSLGLVVLGGSMVVGGVNSGINHFSMATTGKGYNLVGNLSKGVGQWYNRSIGKSLGQTGAGGFVNGLVSETGAVVSGMAQFNVVDTAKGLYSLGSHVVSNPLGTLRTVGSAAGSWWHQVSSGNTYVLGQTTAVVGSLFIGGDETATAKADEATSLLSKVGDLKTLAAAKVSSVVDDLSSRMGDFRSMLSEEGNLRYAFAGGGESRSVLSMVGNETENLTPNQVQMNFNKVMNEPNDMAKVSSKLDDVTKTAKTKTTIQDLNTLDHVDDFKEGAVDHIFQGSVSNKREAQGFHTTSVPDSGAEVLKVISPPDSNGVYVAKVSVDGVPKKAYSTMFPDDWPPQKIVDEINQAYANKKFSINNKYIGTTSDGTKIEMQIKNGKIQTAYPLYKEGK